MFLQRHSDTHIAQTMSSQLLIQLQMHTNTARFIPDINNALQIQIDPSVHQEATQDPRSHTIRFLQLT